MLVLCVGLQKSGSALFYNLINDMLAANGGVCARRVKQEYSLEPVMQLHNNNIGAPSVRRLLRLWWISRKAGTFAVKTHQPPPVHPLARSLYRLGMVRIIYSYRDPRDVALSALDHGQRIRDEGETHTFASLRDLNDAVAAVNRWVTSWEHCRQLPQALLLRYEDLLADPPAVTRRIRDFLSLDLPAQRLPEIFHTYAPDNPNRTERGMHFNKATTSRWQTELSEDQQERVNRALRPVIERMGYSLT